MFPDEHVWISLNGLILYVSPMLGGFSDAAQLKYHDEQRGFDVTPKRRCNTAYRGVIHLHFIKIENFVKRKKKNFT